MFSLIHVLHALNLDSKSAKGEKTQLTGEIWRDLTFMSCHRLPEVLLICFVTNTKMETRRQSEMREPFIWGIVAADLHRDIPVTLHVFRLTHPMPEEAEAIPLSLICTPPPPKALLPSGGARKEQPYDAA